MSEPPVPSKAVSMSAFRTLSKKLSAKMRKPEWHETNDENVKCTRLPEHWRIKKSLGFKFQVTFDNNMVKDGCKVKITASNHKNANALIKNNESVVRNAVAEFNDLRFNSRSGRDTKFNVYIKVDSEPEMVFTYANAIKVTVDGPRPKRTYNNKVKKNCDRNSVGSRRMSGCAAEYLKERIMSAAAAASSMATDSVDAIAAMRFSDELMNQQLHQHQQNIAHQLRNAGADENLDIDAMSLRQRYIDSSATKLGLIDWEMRISNFKFNLQKKDELKSLAVVNPNSAFNNHLHSISSQSTSQSTSPNSNSSSLSEYEACLSSSSSSSSGNGNGSGCGGRSAFSPFNKHAQHQLSHSFNPYHMSQQQQHQHMSNLIQQSSHLQKQRDLETLSQLLQSQLYQNQQHQQQQQALQLLASQNSPFCLASPSGIQQSSSIESLRNMNLDDNLFESSSSSSHNNILSNNNSPLISTNSNSNRLVNTNMLMNRLMAKSNVLCAPVLLPVNQYYNLPYCIVPMLSNNYQ